MYGSQLTRAQNSFKVIIPALIKDIVGDQELPVKAGRLNAISPSRLEIELDTVLDTPLAVKIDPLSLQLKTPHGEHAGKDAFLTVDIGEQKVDGETVVHVPAQEVDVADEEALTAWFNDFFDEPTTELHVQVPDLTTHLGALTYKVDLDKTIRVKGLNYLEGFSAIDMEFMVPPEENGDNIRGYLNIPNSATMTLGLANPSFFMMTGDVKLGLVTLPNLEIKPGNNSAYFHGQMYFDALIPNLPEILGSQGTSFSEGYLDLNCTGNSTYNDDGERIRYLEGVLNHKHIPLRIPITSLLSDILSGFLGGDGILGGGGGNGSSLLDGIGNVVGNETLFSGMLDHFENSG